MKKESQFTQDKSRYNFVSRKVFDRQMDRIDRKFARLMERHREQQVLILALASDRPGRSEEE